MTRTYPLDSRLQAIAHCDERGIPRAGRRAEIDALREAGRRDPSLGRIYEGHLNAAQLVARCGDTSQRARLDADIDASRLFGVWNTQERGGVTLRAQGGGFVMGGAKTWASGAGSIDRALVTAALPDGSPQMCFVDMNRARAVVDDANWDPLGMEGSDSFRVAFDGVKIAPDDLIGNPGDYEGQPWFFGGAVRFLAVQTGVLQRLESEAAAYLSGLARQSDPYAIGRAARIRVAVGTADLWVDAAMRAWIHFDEDPSQRRAGDVVTTVDAARLAVEEAAFNAIEAVMRGVGARGLNGPAPIARLIRDLQMYLRQPAYDAVVQRVGAASFAPAIEARKAEVASSTGTIG